MKRFFSKSKREKGFTLVEMVVVIVILGILGGVGTVGYSGYVQKAQDVNDNTMLAYVNRAFSSACWEKGIDPRGVDDAYGFIWPSDNPSTGAEKGMVQIVASSVDPSGAAFDNFFKTVAENASVADSNSDTPTKFLRHFSLNYVEGEGRFELGEGKRVFAADLGILIDEAINNQFKDSVFFDKDDPDSVKKLMSATDAISLTLSQGQPGEAVKGIAADGDGELHRYLTEVCGYSEDDIATVIKIGVKDVEDCDGNVTQEPDYQESDAQQITAAAILYTADSISNMTASQLTQVIKNANPSIYPSTLSEISETSTQYAAIVGFANSPYSEGFTATLSSVSIDPAKENGVKSGNYTNYTTLKNYLSVGTQIGGSNLSSLYNRLSSNPQYIEYLSAEDGLEQDMEGYIAAMQILSNSKSVLADETGKLDLTLLKAANKSPDKGFGRYTGTVNTVLSYFEE